MDFRSAAATFRHHLQDRFCGWYVEAAKDRLYAGALDAILGMGHPMMPFVTERITQSLGTGPLVGRRYA